MTYSGALWQFENQSMVKKQRALLLLVLRVFTSPVLAALVTLGLFYFMQALISTGGQIEENLRVIKIVDATMPEITLDVIEEIDKPEPIEKLSEQLPETPIRDINVSTVPGWNLTPTYSDVDAQLDVEHASISAADGDYLPLVRPPPQYPNRALQRGIERSALVQFTVNGRGLVVEESIVILDSEPPDTFDRSSIRAVARFKYHPRVVDGLGVDVPNVRTIIRYNIADN